MAGFLLLVAAIGGVVVADLVLENPTAGQATVFTLPVGGHSQGVLLAMAAALGFAVALLLVASVGCTRRRRARRRQLRALSTDWQRQAAAPEGEQAGLLDEWFGRHVPVGDLGTPAPPTGLGREGWEDRPEDRPSTVLPGPTGHHPGSFHQRTRRAAQLRNHPDRFPPNGQQAP
jgi:hypothetical protein